MKTVRYLTPLAGVLFSAALFLTGCGESASYDSTTKRYLAIGEETEVRSGETYVAESADALVTVRHALNADQRYVTLTQGRAYLEGGE